MPVNHAVRLRLRIGTNQIGEATAYDAPVQSTVAAVLFDFGGVISASPFDAFNQYERELGLPEGSIRNLNATDPHTNAWAQLERNEVNVGEFCRRFEAEALAAGHALSGQRVLDALNGEIRLDMVEAVRRCGERLKTACLTNNIARDEGVSRGHEEIMALFDVVIESSKIGVRKPDPRFYEMACAQLAVEPRECVFLDDLGVNLKPARALGMHTIKVESSTQALAELERFVGFPLRDAPARA